MAIVKQHISVGDSSVGGGFTDRVFMSQVIGVANLVGSGAGAVVTTAVALTDLPASYQVIVTCPADLTAFVSSKTATGFNVNLEPRLAASTVAAGTFDVLVIAV